MQPQELDEAADLLAGLRRLREDCFQVAEYSSSLTVALDKSARDRGLKANLERRALRAEKLQARQLQWEATKARAVLEAAVCAWGISARRWGAVVGCGIEQSSAYVQFRLFAGWRRLTLQEQWVATAHRRQEELASVMRQLRSEAAELQSWIWAAQERSAVLAFSAVLEAVSTGLQRTCFSRWTNLAQKAAQKKKRDMETLRIVGSIWCKHSAFSLEESFRHWHALAVEQQELLGIGRHQACVDKRTCQLLMALLQRDQTRVAQIALRAWLNECTFSQESQEMDEHFQALEQQCRLRAEAGIELRRKFVSQSMALLFVDAVDLQVFLDAWKDELWHRRAWQDEEKLRQAGLALSQWSAHRGQLSAAWQARFASLAAHRTLQLCLAKWLCALCASQDVKRQAAVARHQEICRSAQSWTQRSRELDTEDAVRELVRLLRSRRIASVRAAWQRWTTAPVPSGASYLGCTGAEQDARRELVNARARLAGYVAEKKQLEDALANSHRAVLARMQESRETFCMWATIWGEAVARRALVSWKLAAAAEHAARAEPLRELQAATEEEALRSRLQGAREAQRSCALRLLQKQLVAASLSVSLRMWRQHASEERSASAIRRAELEAEARQSLLAQQCDYQRRHHVSRHRQTAVALVLTRAHADNADLLQLSLWGWRRALRVARVNAACTLRLWGLQQLVSIFDAVPHMVRACFCLWGGLAGLAVADFHVQSVAEQTWAETLHGQRHARLVLVLCGALEAGHRRSVLHSMFVAWQRLHEERRVDKAAGLVQDRWRRQDEASKAKSSQMAGYREGLCRLEFWRAAEIHRIKDLHKALLLWKLEAQGQKVQREVVVWEESAFELPETQQRFEAVVRERWVDRCLLLRDRGELLRAGMRAFGSWQAATHSLRWERRCMQSRRQASWVREHCVVAQRASMIRLSFSGWQGAACRIRRRWLERRCRWLERAQQAAARAGSVAAAAQSPAATRAGFGEARQAGVLQGHLRPHPSPPESVKAADSHSSGGLAAAGASPDAEFAARLQKFTFGFNIQS